MQRLVGWSGIALSSLLVATGCGISEPQSLLGEPDSAQDESLTERQDELGASYARVTLAEASFRGLEPLGADFLYEGWLIVDGRPVSAGRFDITDRTREVAFELEGDLSRATAYVLTIEPKKNDDPAPSEVHVLGGELLQGRATLTTQHPTAFGVDLASARGGFILETPTTPEAADFDQGVWYVDPVHGRPSLMLPELPRGWTYEGWIVGPNGPISTGRFRTAAGPDGDGAGPGAGSAGSPPFPGQDFIDPPLSLDGLPVVVSVEPEPDDSTAPFAIKPLVGMASKAAGAGVLQALGAGPAFPEGTVVLTAARRSVRAPAVVVANRGSSTLSVLSASTGRLRKTVALPDKAEPMYVSHAPDLGLILVGDRANSRVLLLDDTSHDLQGSVAVGRGVFHQWYSGKQLWVASDVDATVSVVDLSAGAPSASSVPLPSSLPSGSKPHDVFVSSARGVAFVSIIAPGQGYVVRYDLATRQPTATAEVGGDPHLGFDEHRNLLFVPSQDSSRVSFLDGDDLGNRGGVTVPNAHGAYLEASRRTFFTTDIAAGGRGGLVFIDTRTGTTQSIDTPFATPHNVVGGAGDRTLFVTHSGAKADKVTVYARSTSGTALLREITTGLNPFGLAFVAPRRR